jgi:hypothetical protein
MKGPHAIATTTTSEPSHPVAEPVHFGSASVLQFDGSGLVWTEAV